MAKYYAVRKGAKTGVFNTWEECKSSVNGFSGAEYKSFASLEDAEIYLGMREAPAGAPGADAAVAYVDGSFDETTGRFAFGAVIFHNGSEHTMNGSFFDEELSLMRNVAGEIKGAEAAMSYCDERGIKNLMLYYDYQGIEKWCTGEWKTNKPGTIAYRQFYLEISKRVNVTFNKVKGHSGDRYNDMADSLAKEALGL